MWGGRFFAAACAGRDAALTLRGPTFMTPSTTISTCGAICGGFAKNILEIATREVAFEGQTAVVPEPGTDRADIEYAAGGACR